MRHSKYLLDLLPYKPDTRFCELNFKKRVVSLIYQILVEFIETQIDFFLRKNFLCFDPHVGENLCQIRACQLISIYLQKDNIVKDELQLQLNKDKLILHKIKKILSDDDLLNSESESIFDFLQKYDLNIPISSTIFYLTISHFLTKYKTFNSEQNTIINYDALIKNLNISKHLARKMIHQYQKDISYFSSEFIFSIFRKGDFLTLDINLKLLKLLRHTDDDARTTLSCYVATAILIDYLKMKKINILLNIKSMADNSNAIYSFFYVFNEHAHNYTLDLKSNKVIKDELCFIMNGVTSFSLSDDKNLQKYTLNLKENDIIKIIMSNMAAHRQYSGKKLSPMSENPFSFAKESSDNEISKNAAHLEHGLYAMQEHAKKLGCTSQNYSLFFIRHIFCDNLLRQIELSQNGLFYDDFSYNKIRHYDVDTFTNKQNEAKLAISEN